MAAVARRSLIILLAFVAFGAYVVTLFNQMGTPAGAEHAGMDMGDGAAAEAEHGAADVPATWQGMQRVGLASGDQAIAEMSRLHGKNIPVHAGYRVDYAGTDERVTLWVAHVENAAAAQRMVDQMTAGMAAGDTPFSRPGPVDLAGVSAYRTTGMGQEHYYYARDNQVYWLAASAERARDLAVAAATDF